MKTELQKFIWALNLANQEEGIVESMKADYLIGKVSADTLADAMLELNQVYLKVSRTAIQVVHDLCIKEGLL